VEGTLLDAGGAASLKQIRAFQRQSDRTNVSRNKKNKKLNIRRTSRKPF
jgi:hypothetical protein